MNTVHKKRKTDDGYKYRGVRIRKLASGGYKIVVHNSQQWWTPLYAFKDFIAGIDGYLDNGYAMHLGEIYEASYLSEILNKETAQ